MRFALFLFLFFQISASQAQYKCVENGRTWYTNTPCRAAEPAKPPKTEVQTAAEIQAEFEREVAAKRAQEQREEVEANNRRRMATAAEDRKQATAPPLAPTAASSTYTGRWSIWNYGALVVALYFIPAVIAFFRNHHNLVSISIVNLFLGWTFVGWVVALAMSATPVKRRILVQDAPEPSANDLIEKQIQEQRRAELRAEIQRAVRSHQYATQLLQALARIDGTTSEAERRIIFQFLKDQGAALEERHFPHFYGNPAEEFQCAAEDETLIKLLQPIIAADLSYRIDVISAASAIVATGGTPKKREAETLALIRSALNPAS